MFSIPVIIIRTGIVRVSEMVSRSFFWIISGHFGIRFRLDLICSGYPESYRYWDSGTARQHCGGESGDRCWTDVSKISLWQFHSRLMSFWRLRSIRKYRKCDINFILPFRTAKLFHRYCFRSQKHLILHQMVIFETFAVGRSQLNDDSAEFTNFCRT